MSVSADLTTIWAFIIAFAIFAWAAAACSPPFPSPTR